MKKASMSFVIKQRRTLCLFLLIIPTFLTAQDIVNIFRVGSDICEPVTLKTSKGTYTVRGSITINGNLSWFEAYDCQKRQIVNPGGSTSIRSGQPTVRTYVLKTLYHDSSSGTSGNTNTYRR